MHSMKETSQLTGLTYDTIKFYCNKGLVPRVNRDHNNHRVFDDGMVAWLKSLSCLKNCGLSITDMQTYLAFCLQGQESIPQRQEILAQKREDLLKEMARIQEALAYIDEKQTFYQDVLEEKIPYVSNLIA